MGRRKIEIKAIKDDRNRSVTFLKRKGGLFKKAHELSVLCSVDVAVIIFGQNKKLYEFSSGNIHQTLERYSYYGGPHEHKGPQDFQGKGANDDDDDDDDTNISPPHDEASPPHHGVPQHALHQQQAMQVMSHGTPHNSPPMPSGLFGQGLTPAQPVSRPSSRTSHIRRQSSNLNPGAPAAIQTQPLTGQMAFYPAQPSPQFFPQQQQQQQHQHQQHQQHPQMAMHQGSPPMGTPPLGTPPMQHQQHHQQQHHQHQEHHFQQPQVPHQQFQQMYLQDQERRQSMPSNFQQPQHNVPQNMHMQNPPHPPQQFRSPPMPEPRHLTGDKRSHSVFTPIDDERSVLARFWNEPANQQEAVFVKRDPGVRSYSVDADSQMRGSQAQRPIAPPPSQQQQQQQHVAERTSFDIAPPSRVNSMASDAKRPRLKVSIPTDQSESGDESATRDRNDTTTSKPVTAASSQSSGLVLPAPSPRSAGGDRVLSAGATGPPNPFARPQPPAQAASNAYRDGIDTPMSALPSRVMTEGGFNMGSPSAFFPEGGSWFGQYGGNSLASPATYQPTPVSTNAPSFSEPRRKNDDDEEGSGSAQRRR